MEAGASQRHIAYQLVSENGFLKGCNSNLRKRKKTWKGPKEGVSVSDRGNPVIFFVKTTIYI